MGLRVVQQSYCYLSSLSHSQMYDATQMYGTRQAEHVLHGHIKKLGVSQKSQRWSLQSVMWSVESTYTNAPHQPQN